MKQLMKTAAMEQGKISSGNYLETAAILENFGGCCEGTVFTFTSAGSNGRSRHAQRVHRYKASLLNPHGRLLLKEEPTDSVFTEMRMMPRSSETTASDGVELWNTAKWLSSSVSEGSSRTDDKVDDDNGDLRRHRRIKKLGERTGGDRGGKVELQEAVKGSQERKEWEVMQEESGARKSRRYLKCDNYRERQKYGEVIEDDKSWMWKERKSGDRLSPETSRDASYKCNKPAEERRNKRDSCVEEIHVFEQRKVKCARRKEQDSCSRRYEVTHSEELSKAEDAKQGGSGFRSRHEAAEKGLKKQRAESITAGGGYFADEPLKIQRGLFPESAEEVDDNCLSSISNHKVLGQFHRKRGNSTSKCRTGVPLRPEFEPASNPPLACSFISFKAGVPCIENRRFCIAGEGALRAKPSPDMENEGGGVYAGNGTQSQMPRNNRLSKESNAETLPTPPRRTKIDLDLAVPTIDANMEGRDDETKTGAAKPEVANRSKSTVREREAVSDILAAGPALMVGNMEESCEWGGSNGSISILRGFERTRWENVGHSGTSREHQTSVDEEGYGIHGINVYGHRPRLGREGLTDLSDGLASRLLDWYGSIEVDNDVERNDIEGDVEQSIERDGDFPLRRGIDEPSLIQGPLELCDGNHNGLLNDSLIRQVADVKDSTASGLSSKCVDDVNVETKDRLPVGRAGNSARKPKTQELEKLSLREGPLKRQAWVKGFKRKTGEKVSYFESWLGRGKKDLGSMKLYRKPPGQKGGLKGGEFSKVNETHQLKHDHVLDNSHLVSDSIEQHLISQAWSKTENQAYVAKEFELLDAVLQSHHTMDEDSEGADSSQHTSITASARVLEKSKTQVLDHGDVTSGASNLVIEDKCIQLKCVAQDNLSLKCEEKLEQEGFHQLYPDDEQGTYKSSAKLASFTEQETSHAPSVSNIDVQARECRQTMKGRGPPGSPCNNGSTDDIYFGTDKSEDLEYRVRFEKGVKPSLALRHRDEDMGTIPQSNERLPSALDAQGLCLAEQCGFVFEKRHSSQEHRLTRENDKVAKGEKPCPDLTLLDDGGDVSTQKVLERRDAAIEEKHLAHRFGALSTEISGVTQHNSMDRPDTRAFLESDVSVGSGNSQKVLTSPAIGNLDHSGENIASTNVFSQQLQGHIVSDIWKHKKQVNDSSVKEVDENMLDEEAAMTHKFQALPDICKCTLSGSLGMPQSNNSEIMVRSRDNNAVGTVEDCTLSEHTSPSEYSLTKSFEAAVNSIDLEGNPPDVNSQVDLKIQFPSCNELPKVKEVSEDEKIKESSVVRRHKMPIIVRVRNRLVNGWLLQHSPWKRVGKQKMKTVDSPVLATTGFNQKGRNRDPSNFCSGQEGFIVDSLKGIYQISNEKVTDIKPASIQEKRPPDTKEPKESKSLEAHYETNATMENAKFHPCDLEDLQAFEKHQLNINDEVEQNQLHIGKSNSKQTTLGDHDTGDRDQMKMHNNHGLPSSGVSFDKWQSQVTGFGHSCDTNDKAGRTSIAGVDKTVLDIAELRKFSDLDDDVGAAVPVACLCRRERKCAESQMSSDCSVDELILDNNSETTKSSYCQTEAHADICVPEQKQAYVPMNSAVNLSMENPSPSAEEGAEPELSQESKSLQKFLSLHSQHNDLHISSSMAINHGGEGSPNITTMMHMKAQNGVSADCQSDKMYVTPQVEDVLDYLLVAPSQDMYAPPASFQHQSYTGTAEKEDHKSRPRFGQHFGHARGTLPSYPLLQETNYFGGKDKLVWQDSSLMERNAEEPRNSSFQKRGVEDTPRISGCPLANGSLGDFKNWELMEMMKMPNNQQEILHSHTPKVLPSNDNNDRVYLPSKQKTDWNSYCHADCDRTHGIVSCKDEPPCHNLDELTTEEQVFMERFSATSNNLKLCKLPETTNGPSGNKYLGFQLLGHPNYSASPDLRTQTRLLTAPEGFCCGRPASLASCRKVEPASQEGYVSLINSAHPNITNPSPLGDLRRPDSSQEYQCEGYNTFESQVLPDYAGSFGCVSPSSSRYGSLDISERQFIGPNPCTDFPNMIDHREACGRGADGLHDWKISPTQGHFPSLAMHNSSFLAHNQNLLLNSQQSCSSHTSRSATPCCHGPCNHSCHFSPSVLLNCRRPPCNATLPHHNQCHFAEQSYPVSASMTEPAIFQQTRAPFLHGCTVQYATKNTMHPYRPLQVMQPGETPRSWSHCHSQQSSLLHNHHQLADKNRVLHAYQNGGLSKSNPINGKDQEKGLAWLSEQEINLIQQLRLSGEKAVAVCRQDAAACIQRNWRKYLEKRTEYLKLEKGQQATALSLLATYPMLDDHLQYYKLHQPELSLQICGPSPKELGPGNLAKRWHTPMQKAASIIQRAWRSARRSNNNISTSRELPKDLKTFYDMVKSRDANSSLCSPSFELFAKSVAKIQAATEGARVRRRLKSRRLQTIIMEIKEIRMLLCEMSQEANCDSTPYLFPRLCTQLQQKILQLHTALNGQQMEARFLLRRCPATPLVIYPSRATSPKPLDLVPNQKSMDQALIKLSTSKMLGMVPSQKSVNQAFLKLSSPKLSERSIDKSDIELLSSKPLNMVPSQESVDQSHIELLLPKLLSIVPSQKSVDQGLIKLSSGPSKARRVYTPPLTNPALVVSDNKIAPGHSLLRQSAFPAEKKVVQTQSSVSLIEGSKGRDISSWTPSPDPPDRVDPPDSAKLLPWYFLAHQRSPPERTGGQGTPVYFNSGHEVIVKREVADNLDSDQVRHAPTLLSQNASPKSRDPEYIMNTSFDDKPLPLPQRKKMTEISLEEMAVGGSNASMYMTEYGPTADLSDKPKRPFLKRKSIVMPSQKLDWSKVKPMVSSRLEPELKTKLSLCKGPTKEVTKTDSKKKKANYHNVKSRLFSYEENVSPSASGDGTIVRTTEASEVNYPPMLRSLTRGPSIQGSESGRNSRVLLNRQRAASPDLMHLRQCMAEADRDNHQPAMLETQSVATYSSRFNSARYLHKLGNSEQTSKGTYVGSCQQRTQRIRLRILPQSKENEVGSLFVQEINMQEEMQDIWEDQGHTADVKGKRQQSHSHRYAVYQDPPEQDAQSSSKIDETTRPSSPQDSRVVIVTSPMKEMQDPVRHELHPPGDARSIET